MGSRLHRDVTGIQQVGLLLILALHPQVYKLRILPTEIMFKDYQYCTSSKPSQAIAISVQNEFPTFWRLSLPPHRGFI
jgi:hypothetical protein